MVSTVFTRELARNNKTILNKSEYLVGLDLDHTREAKHTLSYGSLADAYSPPVFGENPWIWTNTLDNNRTYTNYTHLEVRDLTAAYQFQQLNQAY